MNRQIICILVASQFLLLSSYSLSQAQEKGLKGTITLSGAWAIYPTAVKWAEEFQKRYPEVRIEVSAGGAGKGATDAIAGLVDIGMVSRDPDPAEIKKGAFPILILHDAVFPTISENNPVTNDLLRKGVKKNTFIDIWITGLVKTWGQVGGNDVTQTIHVYTRSDACGAAATWAKFTDNKKQEDLKGVGVYGDPGLLETVRKDPLGIGYNNFSYVYTREGVLVPGVRLIPIDANGNNQADADEVLDSRAKAIQAIIKETYPAGRKNYFFTKGKPQGLVKEFIAFALSNEGTRFVEEVGTSIPLSEAERAQVLKDLE